jgi:hypothetical protein
MSNWRKVLVTGGMTALAAVSLGGCVIHVQETNSPASEARRPPPPKCRSLNTTTRPLRVRRRSGARSARTDRVAGEAEAAG